MCPNIIQLFSLLDDHQVHQAAVTLEKLFEQKYKEFNFWMKAHAPAHTPAAPKYREDSFDDDEEEAEFEPEEYFEPPPVAPK